MSEELRHQDPKKQHARRLRPDEIGFMRALTNSIPDEQKNTICFEEQFVVEINDGGMGSLLFVSKDNGFERKLGHVLSEGEFLDRDGVMVSAVINLDADGNLFELDLWKVDFSKIIEFPKPDQIYIKNKMSVERERG